MINFKKNYVESFEQRNPNSETCDILSKRWSPRSFKPENIEPEHLDILIDAARFSPSCYNEQPWKFMAALRQDTKKFNLFLSFLVEANQVWAKNVSALLFLFAKRNFSQGGDLNQFAIFDCGASWMGLTIQAQKMGLYTHAMAGIKYEKIYEEFKISSEKYHLICGIAVGILDVPTKLPESLLALEKPTPRKDISEILVSKLD